MVLVWINNCVCGGLLFQSSWLHTTVSFKQFLCLLRSQNHFCVLVWYGFYFTPTGGNQAWFSETENRFKHQFIQNPGFMMRRRKRPRVLVVAAVAPSLAFFVGAF